MVITNDTITKLRKRIIAASRNKEIDKELLDQLTDEVVEQYKKLEHFSIPADAVEETKDFEHYFITRLKNGYRLSYKGGFDVFVSDRMTSPASTLALMMNPIPDEEGLTEEEKEAIQTYADACEMIFRLPIFVFSNADVTYSMATLGLKYILLLQKLGGVPTAETEDDPEVQKFMKSLSETMDSLTNILEKQADEIKKNQEERAKDELPTLELKPEPKKRKPRKKKNDGEKKNESEGKSESETEEGVQ